MKINYIVTTTSTIEVSEGTRQSIERNLQPEDTYNVAIFNDTINEETSLNQIISTLGDDGYIVLVNDGSIVREFASDIYAKYADLGTGWKGPMEVIKLPIVELCTPVEKAAPHFKGFLNASIWKPYFAENVGELDLTLATRGIDLLLYGALIPTVIAKKYAFNTTLKYYSFFEFLSRLIRADIPVLGIPKITLKCIKDYELKDVSQEEKLKHFKAAQVSQSA